MLVKVAFAPVAFDEKYAESVLAQVTAVSVFLGFEQGWVVCDHKDHASATPIGTHKE